MNIFNDMSSANGRHKNVQIPPRLGPWLAIMLVFIVFLNARAVIVTIDAPTPGTMISYFQDFSVLDALGGTTLNGQSQSVDVFFADNNFMVAVGSSSFTVDLFINQSGPIGTYPTNDFCLTGYLIDAAGNPLSPPVSIAGSGTIPAQVWPDWPFYLPNGTEYLPATTMFEAEFSGTIIYGNPAGYYVDPIIFSGIHFDLKYPTGPARVVAGGRLVMVNFDDPILASPEPVPVYSQYFVPIPQPSLGVSETNSTGSSQTSVIDMQLSGTPGYPYVLESATNLTPPVTWLALMTNSADSNGNWNIIITNLVSVPSEFFQVAAWSGPLQK
jgi:hypothetical protein